MMYMVLLPLAFIPPIWAAEKEHTLSGSVNPNILYIGLLVLTVLAGIGEYFHIVPVGTTTVLVGALIGGGGVHAGVTLANGAAKETANAAKEVSQAAASVATSAAANNTAPLSSSKTEGSAG